MTLSNKSRVRDLDEWRRVGGGVQRPGQLSKWCSFYPLPSSIILVAVRKAVLWGQDNCLEVGVNEPVHSWRCWLVGTWAQWTSNFDIICMLGPSCGNSVYFTSQYLENTHMASQVALVVKNPSADARDLRDSGWIPGSGRSPGGGHGNPLQHSCLEYPMDRGAWRATVYSVARSWTRLSDLACTH